MQVIARLDRTKAIIILVLTSPCISFIMSFQNGLFPIGCCIVAMKNTKCIVLFLEFHPHSNDLQYIA